METLKFLREEKNCMQKDVAKVLNRSITCISDWERGKREPSVDDLKRLADFFGCSVDYLIGRESEDFQIIGYGNDLSKDENGFIEKLRTLTPLRKEVVYRMLDVLVDEQKNDA